MSDLYKRIEVLCGDANVNITTMCKEAEVSRASLTDLKMGRQQSLSADTLSKIASYFGVSVDYLLGNESVSDGPPAPSRPGSKWIPVLGKVAAGTPIEAVEDILDYEEIDAKTAASGEHFAL